MFKDDLDVQASFSMFDFDIGSSMPNLDSDIEC